MIYPFLLLSIWPQNDANSTVRLAEFLSNQIPLSRPVTHLRDFFDARSLRPGDPIFLSAPAVTPVFNAAKELALYPLFPKQNPIKPTPAKIVVVKKPSELKLVAKVAEKPASAKIVAAKPTVKTPVVTKLVRPMRVVELPAASETIADNFPSDVPKTVVMGESVSRVLPTPDQATVVPQPQTLSIAKVVHAASAVSSAPAKSPTPAGSTNTSGYKLEDIPVTLNLVKAPFRVLLDQLTKQTGADILLLADNAPDITIKVTKHRFIDTLSDMCVLANLSYLKVNNEYVIGSDERLKAAYPGAYDIAHPAKAKAQAPEIITETYNTNYCDAQKLSDALAKEFKADELTMIVAPPIAQTNLGSADTGSSTGASSSVLDNKDTKSSRILILRGPRETVDTAVSILKAMDVRPQQVNISVTINDMSLDAEKNLGLEWSFPQFTVQENQPPGIGFANFTRSPLAFNATMNALETQGLDKLLASPNITVQDGQRAYILVGQRLEFPVISSYNQNGTPIFNVDEERVGIYLQVSVWISNDGKVKLELYPQVSTVTSFINVNGGSYPQISTREAQTTLTVESGHTIIIGGLIHDEEITNLQNVPILSKIPIFGALFQNHNKTHTKDEVIITITPTIDPK